jgi:serine/threonine protein kinase
LARAIHVIRQVASSLAEAHDHGFVHRDVKPGNIMLTRRGGIPDFIKVLDFGLARNNANETKLTQAGSLLGTPLYMAPELLNGSEAASAQSDVYATGCVMFFLLTGKDAFSAATVAGVISRHTMGTPSRLEREMIATCPPEISELVHRCIALDRAARFADGAALSDALEALALKHPWTTRDAREAWDRQRTRAEHATTLTQVGS